ncbi:MAG TPA: SBBP repeat-containing protein, partial [Bryobacteraceae bacterium]|nr:SBBP repeat-containing protein [Bryobacteraceae bacterium]
MLAHLICALVLFSTAAWSASGLTYSTYLREGFTPTAIATDPAGNVYLAGSTIIDPSTSQTAAMVVKLGPAGTQWLYVRIFGGSGFDAATGIAVDNTGNAYVTGTTPSPDFPVTPGRQTGTLPGTNEARAFLVKFDPEGEILFSDVLGSVGTTGLAVALAADGGILVSGEAKAGLVASSGAYSVPDSNGRPYLIKVDATGSKVVFTATGIGGDALVVDAAGNIYMAGSAFYLYPTTPGAYQTFPDPATCPECFFAAKVNQYVTKVDPAASKLIYSTGVAGDGGTINKGLAIDAAGNAYVTGVSLGFYPWTGTPPNNQLQEPFLTKLDAAGANALFSIAVGGAGVILGSQGDVYVGGVYNDINLGFTPPIVLPALPPGITSLPTRCQTNDLTT